MKSIKVLNTGVGSFPVPMPFPPLKVKSGTAGSILPGMLVIVDGTNAGYVKAAPTGTASTSVRVGIAIGTSSETAGADGTITVESSPELVVQMYAATPGNLVTATNLGKYTLDVTSGDYLLDENDTTNGFIRLLSFDNATNGLCTAVISFDIWS